MFDFNVYIRFYSLENLCMEVCRIAIIREKIDTAANGHKSGFSVSKLNFSAFFLDHFKVETSMVAFRLLFAT